MNWILITLGAYLAVILGLAVWSVIGESIRGYFLNNKNTGLGTFVFSTFSTMIGAGATVSIVAEVYATGISYGLALPISIIIGNFLLMFLAPKIKQLGDKHDALSVVDVFQKEADTRTGRLIFLLNLFSLAVNIAIQAAAFVALVSVVTGVSYWTALGLSAGLTILYSSLGGLKIDLISDAIQFWIIVLVFVLTAFYLNGEVGSLSGLLERLPAGHLNPFAFGGVGWFVGILLFSPLLWISSPMSWQRIFSAKNTKICQQGFLINALLIVPFCALVIYLGLAGVDLLPEIADKNSAIFAIFQQILPAGLAGVGFASVLAVIMSSVDSMLVAGSTILWQALGAEQTAEKKQVWLARLISLIFGVASFSLIILVPDIVDLAMLAAGAYIVLAIPMLTLFFSRRFSQTSCFWSLLGGTAVLLGTFPFYPEYAFLLGGAVVLAMTFLPKRLWEKLS